MLNYKSLLKVDPLNTLGTRVTKVTKKDYGYRIQMFNSYVTEYFIKLVINENGSAKAHYLVRKNYQPDRRFTLYFDTNGDEINLEEYKLLGI